MGVLELVAGFEFRFSPFDPVGAFSAVAGFESSDPMGVGRFCLRFQVLRHRLPVNPEFTSDVAAATSLDRVKP